MYSTSHPAVDHGAGAAARGERRDRQLAQMRRGSLVALVNRDMPGRHRPQHLQDEPYGAVVVVSGVRAPEHRIHRPCQSHSRPQWGELGRQRDAHDLPAVAGRAGEHAADAVDVPLDEMAGDAITRPKRAFEVHRVSPGKHSKVGSRKRFLDDIKTNLPGRPLGDSKADAVHRDARAYNRVTQDRRALDGQPGASIFAIESRYPAQFFNNSREHQFFTT